MNHTFLISSEDILNPPIKNIGGRCYRQIPVSEEYTKGDQGLAVKRPDRSQHIDLDYYEDEPCDAIKTLQDGTFAVEVQAPETLFKFVIGRKGETRHRLEVETKTKIEVPRQGQNGPIVVKGHDRATVLSAKSRIELLLETSRWKQPFTHFLSIPLTSPDVLEGYDQFKSEVLEQCKGDRGIDASIFQNQQKLHLTIGTLVLLDDREITQASKLLHQCREDIERAILGDRGALDGFVEGLEYMNDDPNNVDVLYARVHLNDQSDRLQEMADRLVQRFVDEGLMVKEYERVKLHCTIMNTIFRTDPSGMRPSSGEEREAFDADNVLKKFTNHHFGNLLLGSIHISTRYTTDQDGYYRPAAKVFL